MADTFLIYLFPLTRLFKKPMLQLIRDELSNAWESLNQSFAISLCCLCVIDVLFVLSTAQLLERRMLSRNVAQSLTALLRFLAGWLVLGGGQLFEASSFFWRSALLGFAATFAISYVTQSTKSAPKSSHSIPFSSIFFFCCVAPLLEELFYRKLVFQDLCGGKGLFAVLISSFWFISGHDFLQWRSRFLRSCIYCMCTLYGSVWSAVLVHCCLNIATHLKFFQ
jgi:membrane protease YdiL (CAAX protease family)